MHFVCIVHVSHNNTLSVKEDMTEELFGYSAGNRNNLKDKELPSTDPGSQNISLLNVKKSCNLAVVFKAMNVRVQEIHDALIEGICRGFNIMTFEVVFCL